MILNSFHKNILAFLSSNTDESFTLMDIGNEVGLDHPQKVQDKLSQLEKGGFIKRNPFGGFQVAKISENDNKIYLPFFGFAQCGNAGEAILDEYPKKKLPVDKDVINPMLQDEYFITRAKGDSMQPFIDNGDFVLIKVQEGYNPEDKVLIVNDGIPKIKKVISDGGKVVLRSFNNEHKDFVLDEDNENHVVGIVKKTFPKGTYIV
ncbi:MAG: S24 family peptidase [Candidatus Gracilibacteria bacterium]|nr:S24 family peptidase [Candidatus Gracilibacteria bacterium]